MTDAMRVHLPHHAGYGVNDRQALAARWYPVAQPFLHTVFQRDISRQLLGHQNGLVISFVHARTEVNRLRRRDSAMPAIHHPSKLAHEGWLAALRVPPGLRVVIFLTLQKDRRAAAFRQAQLASRHSAPTTSALIGFFKPGGLVLPYRIEVVQAVEGQDRTPAFVDKVFHVTPRLVRRSSMGLYSERFRA